MRTGSAWGRGGRRGRQASPWRDPRALASSLLVHAMLVGLAVAVTWATREPAGQGLRARLLDAELDVGAEPAASGASSDGGADVAVMLEPAKGGGGAARLPGGGAPGAVFAGGEAEGGGLRGAGGPGRGEGAGGRGQAEPAVEFFGMREQCETIAYVIDRSGSMGTRDALGVAKRELRASVGRLPARARFGVVFYNLEPEVFADAGGTAGLMANSAANRTEVDRRLDAMEARGGTRPRPALRAAFAMRPEVIFLLTDGQELSEDDLRALGPELKSAGTRIHVIEFGGGPPLGEQEPLTRLARMTGGTYQRIDPGRLRGR